MDLKLWEYFCSLTGCLVAASGAEAQENNYKGLPPVPVNFTAILAEHGFTSQIDAETEEELYSTITAFDHETNAYLFDDDSPFEFEGSDSRRQPGNFECMLFCHMKVKADWELERATCELINLWYRYLAYSLPKIEIIERCVRENDATVRILLISSRAHNACTFEFNLSRENYHE